MAWDSETDEILTNVTVDFQGGVYTFSCNGLFIASTIDAMTTVIQQIALESGWYIFSTYVEPEIANVENVVSEIVDDVIIIKDWEGNVFWPLLSINTLGEIDKGMAYQIKSINSNILEIEGNLVDYDFGIDMPGGWFLLGYLHQQSYNVEDMMVPIIEDLQILKSWQGNVYWPLLSINTIGEMNPGEGYQIKTDNNNIFSYPIINEEARYGDIYTERPIHFDEPANTGSNMIIGFPQYAWESTLSIGDEIAAYDEEGRLIGSTVYEGNNLALTVWGDDMTTHEKDGLIESERIIFRLWNSTTSTEQVLDIKWEEGSGIYSTDGISVAGQIILGNEVTSERQLVKITDVLGKGS